MVTVIGISDSTHDRSVVLYKDEKAIVGIEEERLTRIKHSMPLPMIDFAKNDSLNIFSNLNLESEDSETVNRKLFDSIKYCLDFTGINFEDVDLFIGTSLHFHRPLNKNVIYINHQLAHACSAFYPSPFEEAAILIFDGYGDSIRDETYEISLYGYGNSNKIKIISVQSGSNKDYYDMTNSLGVFYRNCTVLLGFGVFGQGKTMGISAFGTNKYYSTVKKYVKFSDEGQFEINNKDLFLYFKNNIIDSKELSFQDKADIAYAFQKILEDIVLYSAKYLRKKTKSDNLCLAGGVALNSVGNYRLIKESGFKRIFILPASGDNGLSIGCATYGLYNILKKKRNIKNIELRNAYLGKIYSENEILGALNKYPEKIVYKKIKSKTELLNKASSLLADQKIIGWFQGGSEIGPRALGHRSILADPREAKMKDTINKRIKHRESFRPFAPSILLEFFEEYFDSTHPVPFMLLTPPVKDDKKNKILAVVHVDGSARVQTVSKKDNDIYYGLIQAFYEKTNVPVLLNTSFNDNNEPMIETPEDAIKCFLKTDLDYLFIHNFMIEKR